MKRKCEYCYGVGYNHKVSFRPILSSTRPMEEDESLSDYLDDVTFDAEFSQVMQTCGYCEGTGYYDDSVDRKYSLG